MSNEVTVESTNEADAKTIRYAACKDAELMSLLRERNLAVPFNEQNRLVRSQAVALLKQWDNENPYLDTERTVRVIFHNSTNPSAGNYVYASINNKNFQAPFEKEVTIPEYFLSECIDRACTVRYEYDDDNKVTIKKIPTYPYTIVGYGE